MALASEAGIRIVAVAGARPNFMKIAPLVHELRARGRFHVCLVHTGQHYDARMSETFFEELGIPPPDYNLGVGSASHGEQTGEILRRIEPLLQQQQPDVVVVVGDVNSTLAASLAAAKLCIPVAHIEAGLRSFDRTMPEEINRLLTDALSDLLFITEPAAEENLRREGVPASKIHFVGNVMIDTLLSNLERARKLPVLERLGLRRREYALLTLHRPSNVDQPERFRSLFSLLESIHSEIPVVFPVHPRTAVAIARTLGGEAPRLLTTEPLGYLEFLRLMADSRFVLTDSGGVQEETTVLGVPCLTLRDNTERPVTVTHGTNTVVGSEPSTILAEVRKILDGLGKHGQIPEKWDGGAAQRIVDVLEARLIPRGGSGRADGRP